MGQRKKKKEANRKWLKRTFDPLLHQTCFIPKQEEERLSDFSLTSLQIIVMIRDAEDLSLTVSADKTQGQVRKHIGEQRLFLFLPLFSYLSVHTLPAGLFSIP